MSKKGYSIRQALIDKHVAILEAVEIEIEKTECKSKKFELLQNWKKRREYIKDLISAK